MLDRIAAALMVLLVAVVALGVSDRFLLGLGLAWPEELARFLLVWLSLLAAVVAMRKQAHFRIEMLVLKLGRGYGRALALAGMALCLATAWFGLRLALRFHVQTSPALGVPMSTVYAAVPTAFLGMSICLLRDAVASRPAEEHGGDEPKSGAPREGS